MRELVRGGVGKRVVGEIGVYIRLTCKEGVNTAYMSVGHRLAEHDALDAAMELGDKGVLLAGDVVSVHKLVVKLLVAIGHYRKSVALKAYLALNSRKLLKNGVGRVAKLVGADRLLVKSKLFIKP